VAAEELLRHFIVTSQNFSAVQEHLKSILLPYSESFRGRAVLAQEIAVLLITHISDDVIRILTEAMVRVITSAPYTTQVFQVLDLTLFGVLKPCPRYELPFDGNNATVKVIMKVYRDFRQTIIKSNIWRAFLALGLEFDMRREPDRLSFNEEKLRERAGFQGRWSPDFPLDQLSGRRRIARFGCINKAEKNDLTSVDLCLVHQGLENHPLSGNEKAAGGVIPHIYSWDLHGNRFFVENKARSLFYC
jgi:hypothetical protein